jgi:hypothetical protein
MLFVCILKKYLNPVNKYKITFFNRVNAIPVYGDSMFYQNIHTLFIFLSECYGVITCGSFSSY